MKRFDRKFGAEFLASLPFAPAVYLFKDEAEQVIYVGKAKNIRRRLSNYRNASRRKAHRKMRAIVKAATALEVRVQETEHDALVLENELIRTLEPAFNVVGKYWFLYPAIGTKRSSLHSTFCFTTDVEAWADRELTWFGTFPSRPRAKEAFDALVELLALVGHLEPSSALGPIPDVVGSRITAVRQLEPALFSAVESFLAGKSVDALRDLTIALLEKPRARREATYVEELIRFLEDFFYQDLQPLCDVLRRSGRSGTFVPQYERDTFFLRHHDTSRCCQPDLALAAS